MKEPSAMLQIEEGILVSCLSQYADEIIIPEGVIEIKDSAFENNYSIKKVYSKSSCLKRIGKAAFKSCMFLEEAFFTNVEDEIGEEAFAFCSALKSVTFSTGTFKVGKRAFADSDLLRSIILPDGVTAIEDNAFIHTFGRSMLFVSVPPSVYDLSDRATDGPQYILGDPNSILPSYCGAYKYRRGNFLANNAENLKILNDRLVRENAVESKEFTVFGESFVASNTLCLYQETVKYYEDKREACILNVIKSLPAAINGQIDLKPLDQLNDLRENMGKRLSKYGIPRESVTSINSNIAFLTLQREYLNLLSVCKNMLDVANEYMDNLGRELAYEAESKVTGLSYGIISSSALDMIAYSIDDLRTRQRQRETAYATADKVLKESGKQARQLVQGSFKAFAQKLIPSFEEAISKYISALIQDELEILDHEGFIQKEIIDNYDISKSVSIIEQAAKNNHINKKKALGSALREYPNNKGAFAFARDNGLFNNEVEALEAFFKAVEEERAKAEAEEKAKAEAEARAKAKAEAEARAKAKAEAEEKAKAEAEAIAKAKAKARAKAAEEKKRQEERLSADRARYDKLSERMKQQETIIAQNTAWFGAEAKVRKAARRELRSIESLRKNEFPNGRP